MPAYIILGTPIKEISFRQTWLWISLPRRSDMHVENFEQFLMPPSATLGVAWLLQGHNSTPRHASLPPILPNAPTETHDVNVFNDSQSLPSGKGNAKDGRAKQTAGEQGDTGNGWSVIPPDKTGATEADRERQGAAAAASTSDGGGGGKCMEIFKYSAGSGGVGGFVFVFC